MRETVVETPGALNGATAGHGARTAQARQAGLSVGKRFSGR
ncbi:hypothetical protein PUN4_960016 [Paraburkholderia unamae]|nr:hypothetical protein PUN4_960016 [Paraburkholderia unamae]